MKTYSTGGRLIAIILTTAFLTGEVGSGCMGAVKVYAAESEVLSAEEMTGMIPVSGDEVISEDIILSEDETGYDGSGEREGIVLTDVDVLTDANVLTDVDAPEDGMKPEDDEPEEDLDIVLPDMEYLPADGEELSFISAGKVAWQTGVAAVGEFVPYGRALFPFLNMIGGLMDSGPTNEDVYKKIDEVSNGINYLNKDLEQFRSEAEARLDELDKKMSDEIDTALNKIKNDVFINGVGSELDTLHAQINDKDGIASQIDIINNDTTMSDKVKAIEIASLIGNDKNWDETNNALYRFNNVGDLVAGQTYRDTGGRNLYQVLYDNAKLDHMFSGETYDSIDPYIERVVDEYFYAYTVLSQCLTAHLTVSRMTDEEARALGDAEYKKYLQCKTRTSLVKMEMDDINKELLDAGDSESIISLYSVFKYKYKHERFIFIDEGKTEIAVSNKLAQSKDSATGRKRVNISDHGVLDIYEMKSQWYLNSHYTQYYRKQNSFVSGGTILEPAYVKDIYDHLQRRSSRISFYDYLKNNGFDIARYGKNSFFATSKLKTTPVSFSQNRYWGCEYGFETFYMNMIGDPKTERPVCTLSVQTQTIKKSEGGLDTEYKSKTDKRKHWTTHNYVYVIPSGSAFMGFTKVSREKMPGNAAEVYEKDRSGYTVTVTNNGSFEIRQKYDLNEQLKVTFKDANGKAVSNITKYQWEMDLSSLENGGHLYDDRYAIFTKTGSFRLAVIAEDPAGKPIYSDWVEVKINDQSNSRELDINCKPKGIVAEVGKNYKAQTELFDWFAVYSLKEGQYVTDYDLIFQSYELPEDGIELETGGGLKFTRPGTYNIRCKVEDSEGGSTYTEWCTFRVKDPQECFTMTFLDSDGTILHNITKEEGSTIDEDEIPDGVEAYHRSKLELSGGEEVDFPETREGYTFVGWDLISDEAGGDGESDEMPDEMSGEDVTYKAIWQRTVKDGYLTVTDADSLTKAVSGAKSSETAYIALGNDVTLNKLDFPKSGNAAIVIDGMGHTLTFSKNAVVTPKDKQSLLLEDITIKAETKGKAQNISLTAAAGGIMLGKVNLTGKTASVNGSKGNLTLDNVMFNCDRSSVNAAKDSLLLKDVIALNLTVKGSSKTVLTTEGEVGATTITGFKRVDNKGVLAPAKTLKVNYLNLSGNALLNVVKGASVTISKGISGSGTINLHNGFKPVVLGKDNSGSIRLVSDEALEYRMIFKTKAANLNKVFDVRELTGDSVNGKYEYGLYSKGDRAYLRAFTIKYNGNTYCEWQDMINDINRMKPAGEAVVTLLADVDVPGTLKLPARGRYTDLTINGGGHRLTFNSRNVTLTGNLTLRNISLASDTGEWILKKGKYEPVTSGTVLIGCTIKK